MFIPIPLFDVFFCSDTALLVHMPTEVWVYCRGACAVRVMQRLYPISFCKSVLENFAERWKQIFCLLDMHWEIWIVRSQQCTNH